MSVREFVWKYDFGHAKSCFDCFCVFGCGCVGVRFTRLVSI